MSGPSHVDSASPVLQDADLCVKCGLCLPHCPTYQDSRHEADSPRGRIALAQGLITGLLQDGPGLRRHLDGCLSCRRCESVCPARVPYGRILDTARGELVRRDPRRARLPRAMGALLRSGVARSLLRGLIGLYRRGGLQGLVRRFRLLGRGRLARLESLLPEPAPALPRLPAPVGLPIGLSVGSEVDGPVVALFRGCVGDVLERDVAQASRRLLEAAGYRVIDPSGQTCCGALYQHAGLRAEQQACAQRNLSAFGASEAIASPASGCAAGLRDYADLPLPGAAAFAARVQDVMALLRPRLDRLRFRPLPLRAALHLPCTQGNVMGAATDLRAVLAAVPGLALIELDPAQACCGAAGMHFVTDPEAADRLLAPKLAAVERLAPDLILSGNVGCSLHLQGGLTRQGRAARPPVRHPVRVLAEQLLPPGPRS